MVVGRLLVLVLSVVLGMQLTAGETQKAEPKNSETVEFFDSGVIPELKLVINEEGQQKLREAPRDYVRGSLVENGDTSLKSIGIKLKGAAGSYRDFDDRPGLTLNIDKYKKDQRWHGMEKLHLNNAVQDESYLCEWLGSKIFREAGYPAPLAGHVRLWINDRDMGIYVLREGFDDPFLKRSFDDKNGNLYDGGFVQDIDSELEMDSGDDPDERSDLIGLATSCYHPHAPTRWNQMAERVDIEQFIRFMALERICGHWDGYTLNMNNYRVYFPREGRAVFLPHGMDQLFGDPGAGVYDFSTPLLAAAVMQNNEWRGQYRKQLQALLPVIRPIDRWLERIDARRDQLQPHLEAVNPDQAAAHRDRVNELKDRLTERAEQLEEIINTPDPQPIEFDEQGVAHLADWYPVPEAEEVRVEEADLEGVASYMIARDRFGDYGSSWRQRVVLPRGNYRFQARIKTDSVIPIPDDMGGAGVRVSGMSRAHELAGTSDWRTVTLDLEVAEDLRDIELLLEIRARRGTVWFDRGSLKIERVLAP